MSGTTPLAQARQASTCPVCRKPASPGYRPFCGRRCADVDLGRWLNGRYAVPGEEVVPGHDGDDDGQDG